MAWWMQGGAPNDACSVAWRCLWLPSSVAVIRAFGREEALRPQSSVGCYEAPCLTSCRGRPRQKDEAGDQDNALPRDETLQERARLARLQESRRHSLFTKRERSREQLLPEGNSGPPAPSITRLSSNVNHAAVL